MTNTPPVSAPPPARPVPYVPTTPETKAAYQAGYRAAIDLLLMFTPQPQPEVRA